MLQSSEIGCVEPRVSCLFDMVVRMNLVSVCGSFLVIRSRSSDVVVVDGRGKDRVEGRPSPGIVVTKTLRFFVAIVNTVCDVLFV